MVHLAPLLRDLTILLITAASVTVLFRKLKLPLVLGYLVAGILVGPFFPIFPTLIDTHNLEAWAEIGVIFLLFSLGLEFSYKKLVRVGRSAFITGLFEIGGVFTASFLLGRLMQWPTLESLFLAGALSISSTSIIVRTFSELRLKGRRFVSLVYGVLLVEDLMAILFLVLMSTVGVGRELSGWDLLSSVGNLLFFLLLYFVLGMFLVPLALQKVRKLLAEETLLIVSVGLCLLMVFVATKAGFSSALGAFLMGSILAGTPEGPAIEERMAPLRDLFSAIFFVSIGMLIDLNSLWANAGLVAGVALFVILSKFIFVTGGSLLAGQNLRWSLQSGLSLTQIGEFSFLMAKLGSSLQVLSDRFFPLVVLVSAVTSFGTPLLLRFSDPIVDLAQKWLPQRLKTQLENYQSHFSPRSSISRLTLVWRAYGMTVIVNMVIIVGVTLLARNVVLPALAGHWPWTPRSLRVFAVVSCIAVCVPFYWALLNAQPSHSLHFNVEAWEKLKRLQFFLFVGRLLLTTLLLVFQASEFLSLQSSLWMLLGLFTVLFLLRAKAETTYRQMEQRFLDHLNEKEREELARTMAVPPLAPWDAQLVELTVASDSPHVGQTYQDAHLRENYGITVALVERGKRKILAPNRDERIYPGDHLFVIGNEEQIIQAREQLEKTDDRAAMEDLSEDFGLEFMIVEPQSQVVGKSIRECGLRERVDGLIVGMERAGHRILNPESTLILEPFDLLWIVGSREKIERERKSFSGIKP
jgi:CPA2 family monovalent cation:H+ antiporter-2